MKRISILITFLLATILPSWAAKVPALSREEAIMLLEAFDFAQGENHTAKEAQMKKLPFPSVEVINKFSSTAYQADVLSWEPWLWIIQNIEGTTGPNNGTFDQAFIIYDSIWRLNWRNPINIYNGIFFKDNLELYSMPMASGKVLPNRFEHFKAYLEELADMDILSRAEKAKSDFGNEYWNFIFWTASNFDRFFNLEKSYVEGNEWFKRLEGARAWSKQSSIMADEPHNAILVSAFGQEVIDGWKENHPALLNGSKASGVMAVSLAVSLSQASDKEKLNSFNSLFIFFASKAGSTLFREQDNLIKNLRAFYKKHQGELAKMEKSKK